MDDRLPDTRLLKRHAATFSASTTGNIATLTALTMPVALMLAAFAVDEGALYLERRELQSLTDLAAITAAANIDTPEKAVLTVLADNNFQDAKAAEIGFSKSGSLESAGYSGGIDVTTGTYTPDPDRAVSERFIPGATPANAVRVNLRQTGQRYFAASIIGTPVIGASAVATAKAEAAFSVGSRLARLDGGIANALLGGLTGSAVSLSVMDYNALLSADVRLLSVLDALDTRLALNAATYDDVLAADATIGDLYSAIGDSGGLDALAKAAIGKLADNVDDSDQSLPLSHLFSLGSLGAMPLGAAPANPDPMIGAMELASAAAALSAANGHHQVELDLGASVAGLAAASLSLAIGEPAQFSPWFSIGDAETLVKTAQTRLMLRVNVGGPGGLLGTSINLPIYLELASAEAKLARVTCSGSGGDTRVSIAARPGIATLRIAEMSGATLADFSRAPALIPAQLVSTPLLKISGTAEIGIANRTFSTLQFSAAEIARREIKQVSTTDIIGSLTRSLLEGLKLDVNVAGLGLGVPSNLTTTLANTLGAVTPAIDALLVNVLATFGVTLGEADIRVYGTSCGRAVLVQ